MNIISVALKRHSVKAFDPNKKLTADEVKNIKTLLQYSPSSTNSQPWHFIIVSTEIGKSKIANSTTGIYEFNKNKILNASHIVIFCAKTKMDDLWLKHVIDREEIDGRFATFEDKVASHKNRCFFANMHRIKLKDDNHWIARQVYLNVGNFLLGVAALGFDAVPIEGFDTKILDNEFSLNKKKLTSLVIVAVGYSSSDDFNAFLPKSRLPQSEIITEC